MPFLSAAKVATVVATLMLGAAAAQASEATLVADRAGFLLGHAHRCGVEDARLQRSESLIGKTIAAFARDDDDKEDAATMFAQRVLASALAQILGDPAPSCARVRAELARLERHHAPAPAPTGKEGDEQMARNKRLTPEGTASGPAADTGNGAKPAKALKSGTTRPEELTVDERAVLELKRAARQMRGRPPSI